MNTARKLTKKFFTPPVIDNRYMKEDFCCLCGAPLNKGKWDNYINKFLQDFYTLIIQQAPEDETIDKLCGCDTPSEYINKAQNLIMCKGCGLQVGYKTHNACNAEWKSLLRRIFEQERGKK